MQSLLDKLQPAAGRINCLRLYRKMPVGQMTLVAFALTRQPIPNTLLAPAASVQNCAFIAVAGRVMGTRRWAMSLAKRRRRSQVGHGHPPAKCHAHS